MTNNGTNHSPKLAIILTLIPVFGTIIVALIANWDKIFINSSTSKSKIKVTNLKENLPLNGKTVESNLDDKEVCLDIIYSQNLLCEKYTFFGKSGQKATIEMKSDDFDPFLILRNPDGDKLAVNGDISAENWNAKIVVDLTDDGDYTIISRTTSVGETGKYSIRAVVK
ncbi:MAG: hypothetical protein AAGE84_02695 [Cyanobacteria bacterium P01_G01_bin.39]